MSEGLTLILEKYLTTIVDVKKSLLGLGLVQIEIPSLAVILVLMSRIEGNRVFEKSKFQAWSKIIYNP